MKVFMVLTILMTINSTSFASPQDACTADVLRRASLVKATAQDIVRTTDDALDLRIDKFSDEKISDIERSQATRAEQILKEVRLLQLNPNDGAGPALKALCNNGFSVQKTISQQ